MSSSNENSIAVAPAALRMNLRRRRQALSPAEAAAEAARPATAEAYWAVLNGTPMWGVLELDATVDPRRGPFATCLFWGLTSEGAARALAALGNTIYARYDAGHGGAAASGTKRANKKRARTLVAFARPPCRVLAWDTVWDVPAALPLQYHEQHLNELIGLFNDVPESTSARSRRKEVSHGATAAELRAEEARLLQALCTCVRIAARTLPAAWCYAVDRLAPPGGLYVTDPAHPQPDVPESDSSDEEDDDDDEDAD
jgi:hypothetical protein